MMDEITRRRWEMRQNPAAFKPEEALKAALHDIEAGDLNPTHVVVVYNQPAGEDAQATGYYQAGKFSRLETMGVLAQALQIIGDRD